MAEHEDLDQVPVYIPLHRGEVTEAWCTLCSCGMAFWDSDSVAAHAAWEDHEAKYS